MQLALWEGARVKDGPAERVAAGETPPPPRTTSSHAVIVDGYSIHAGHVVDGTDRKGLEKLVRYILRPPLCLGRLGLTDEGQVTYRLPKADKKGRTLLVMSPMEFMARLSALMPAPRFALRRCFGLLASGAKRRAEVVPHKKATPCCHDHGDSNPPTTTNNPTKRPATRVPWRDLLQRI